jgi:curved DNA-binding protein CbpA
MGDSGFENKESQRPAFRGYYETLGVGKGATKDEIRDAYRNSIKSSHPDTHPGDNDAEERTKMLNEAYTVLSNDQAREKYNQQLEQMAAAAVSTRASGKDYSFMDAMQMWYEQMFNKPSDIFRGEGKGSAFSDRLEAERQEKIKAAREKGERTGRMAAEMMFDEKKQGEMMALLTALDIKQKDLYAVDHGYVYAQKLLIIHEIFPDKEKEIRDRLEALQWARQRMTRGDWGQADLYCLDAFTARDGKQAFGTAIEGAWIQVQNQAGGKVIDRDRFWFVPQNKVDRINK